MANKKIFFSKRAPFPKGPYSQGVIHRGILYISGQCPVDPLTGRVIAGTIKEETRAVLENLRAIVEDSGGKMTDVLKVTCYLSDMADFAEFNGVYKEYFPEEPPARTTLQAAGLPMNVKVEIDAVVKLDGEA